jgi:hypothetical protein
MRYITILFVLLTIASAADRDLSGRYAGEWKSNGPGGSGSLRMSLEPAPNGAWKCEIVFTFGGEEIKTTIRQVKVEQSKMEVAYDFQLDGNELRSRITGEWNGKAFDGRYHTTEEDGTTLDEGVWKAGRK